MTARWAAPLPKPTLPAERRTCTNCGTVFPYAKNLNRQGRCEQCDPPRFDTIDLAAQRRIDERTERDRRWDGAND